jgi:hypothetical protein
MNQKIKDIGLPMSVIREELYGKKKQRSPQPSPFDSKLSFMPELRHGTEIKTKIQFEDNISHLGETRLVYSPSGSDSSFEPKRPIKPRVLEMILSMESIEKPYATIQKD